MPSNVDIGSRVRLLRLLTKLNRKEFCQKFNLKESTLSAIELGRLSLSEKKLQELLDIFFSEGINASAQWLLSGEGASPKEIIALKNELKATEEQLSIIMPDNSMSPIFEKGDYIGGTFCELNESLAGQKCILQREDKSPQVCIIRKMGEEFIAHILNSASGEPQFFKIDKKSLRVAKVQWIKKMD